MSLSVIDSSAPATRSLCAFCQSLDVVEQQFCHHFECLEQVFVYEEPLALVACELREQTVVDGLPQVRQEQRCKIVARLDDPSRTPTAQISRLRL